MFISRNLQPNCTALAHNGGCYYSSLYAMDCQYNMISPCEGLWIVYILLLQMCPKFIMYFINLKILTKFKKCSWIQKLMMFSKVYWITEMLMCFQNHGFFKMFMIFQRFMNFHVLEKRKKVNLRMKSDKHKKNERKKGREPMLIIKKKTMTWKNHQEPPATRANVRAEPSRSLPCDLLTICSNEWWIGIAYSGGVRTA